MSKEVEIPNLDDLIRRYQAGASIKKISDESGIGRNVLTRRFRLNHVDVRSQSEAERLKWAERRKDPEAVRRQCSAAWSARSGSSDTWEVKLKRARTRYKRVLHASPYEAALAACISDRGFDMSPQFAAGPYNLDLALYPLLVAVEVESATSRAQWRALRRKRLEYLLDRSWSVIVATFAPPDSSNGWTRPRDRLRNGTFAPENGKNPDRTFDVERVADKLVAYFHSLGGLPSPRGQYGVIGREAQPVPLRRSYLDRWPRIPGF